MKKIILSLLAISTLLISCNKDEEMNNDTLQNEGGEVAVSFTTSLFPEARMAYARINSEGGLGNVDNSVFDVRFILEIREKDGSLVKRVVQTVDNTTTPTTSFNFRLVAGNYDFLFWADFVDEGSETDLYYNTNPLTKVTVNSHSAGNNDAHDAYSATTEVNLSSATGPVSKQITLTRPFGKLRTVATDLINDSRYKPTQVSVSYTGTVATGFNVLTNEITTESKTMNYTTAVDFSDNSTSTAILSWNYLLPKTEGGYTMTIATTGNNGKSSSFEVANIPVKRNHITTVRGNLLTLGTDIVVDTDGDFENGGSSDGDNNPTYDYSLNADFDNTEISAYAEWKHRLIENVTSFPNSIGTWTDGLEANSIANGTLYHPHTSNMAVAWATPMLSMRNNTQINFMACIWGGSLSDSSPANLKVMLMNKNDELTGTPQEFTVLNYFDRNRTVHFSELGVSEGNYRVVFLFFNEGNNRYNMDYIRIDS
ncbi:MAG: DUF6562 domain-containing protein [Paludibacteraceae bacterium]